MGRKKDPKKEQARKLQNAKHKAYKDKIAADKQRRAQYPEFLYDTKHGDPSFVSAVVQAVNGIDFDDRSAFSEAERYLYREMRKHGGRHALRLAGELFRSHPIKEDPTGEVRETLFALNLGSLIYSSIPLEVRKEHLPYNDCHVNFGREIVLKFSSLLAAKGDGGRIYYSRREPHVEFGGVQYIASFSRHAVDRLCERLQPNFTEYAGAGDLHAALANCVYFEPARLSNGDPAFVIYGDCDGAAFTNHRRYVKEILGVTNIYPSLGRFYYRIGYFPVVFEGKFAKATTFLYPGYKGTPEHQLIKTARLRTEERQTLLQQTQGLDAEEVLINDGSAVIKWFHDHGIPQVVQMKRKVYELLGQ